MTSKSKPHANLKWDVRFVELAEHVAQWSKDPNTKVGAVIVRPNRTVVSLGYNGFPRGVDDTPDMLADRDEKLARTIHAELNAILTAKEDVTACTLYVSHPCCDRCAVHIIQAGIACVVWREPGARMIERWGPQLARSQQLFRTSGVGTRCLPRGLREAAE